MTAVFKIVCIISIFLLAGCESQPEENLPKENLISVVYVNTLSGGGDIGYTDQIIEGLMRFNKLHKSSMSLKNPIDMNEVADIIQDWYVSSQKEDNKSLLVLGDYTYEQCLNNLNLELSDSHSIILVDTPFCENRQKGIHSFFISRFGISFLAGLMAGESEQASILAACRGVSSIDESVAGFSAGYREASGQDAHIYYLDSDYKGFSMPQKAFEWAKDLDCGFIFPLAGGSNNGVLRYTRQFPFTTMLVAGMDVDCSGLSTRVPFSVIIPISEAVEAVLTDWYDDRLGEGDLTFYLGDKLGAKIMINTSFLSNAWIWEDYYDFPEYWRVQLEKYSEEARLMEKKYYGLL